MKSFKRYIHRRDIRDVKAWISSRGFKTYDEFSSFCIGTGVNPPSPEDVFFSGISLADYFSGLTANEKPEENINAKKQEKKPRQKSPKNKAVATSSNNEEESEVWHIPAAERPLGKSKEPVRKKSKKSTRSRK